MELNKDCIRDILLYIEQHNILEKDNFGKDRFHIVTFDELCKSDSVKYEDEIIYYAIQKMEESNLIKFNSLKNHSNLNRCFINYHITEITSKGHEFLDNVKNPDIWNEIKTAIKNAETEDASIDVYFKYIYNKIIERIK